MKKLLALSGLVLATSTAFAVEQPYLGLDYVQSVYELDGGGDASPAFVQLRAGTDLTRNLGLEARVSVGVADDVITSGGIKYALNIDSMYTFGVVGRLPWGNHGSLYAQAAYSYMQISAESSGILPDTETNDGGFSWGAGFVFPAWHNYNLELDYTSYFDGNEYMLSGFGVGFRRYF
ncbi:MAG: outer membrane beta-barrel protein [Pseudomonadota bacterium]